MPEPESAQLNVTVTFVLFQPAEFANGDVLAAIVGGVLSILTLTVAVPPTPALFVAVPCTTCLGPSVVRVTGEGQLFIPTLVSAQVNVTVTLELFQLLALGGGLKLAEIVGGGGITAVAEVVAVPVIFLPSSTVNVTVNVPAEE